jgi:guanosine-3',5'-bis(diphosphate) 3'-pyrophosphohydrolase
MSLIIMAAQLAAEAHKGQTRKWGHKNDPYILHPIRVAGRIAIHRFATEDMVAAALLHDSVEDSDLTEETIIAKGIGARVAYLVTNLTNTSKGMNLGRSERKRIDRERLKNTPWEARLIKLADRLDNIRDINGDSETPKDFDTMYRRETLLLLDVLKGTDIELEAELAEAVDTKSEAQGHDNGIDRTATGGSLGVVE